MGKQNEPTGKSGRLVSIDTGNLLGGRGGRGLGRGGAAAATANGDDGESENGGENEQLLHQRLPIGGLDVGRHLRKTERSPGHPGCVLPNKIQAGLVYSRDFEKATESRESQRIGPIFGGFGRAGE